jgi:DNA-binding IclR family transcriptional regulator
MERSMKSPPTYGISSVDHALRLAVVLQMEREITVTTAAERLGVARSTAHRLLQALVYRDFAVQSEDRTYRAGPVLDLAAHSTSGLASIRVAALGPLRALVDTVQETANLLVRTGTTARFLASVECDQVLRVVRREGMVFPAHLVTGGLVMLATLEPEQIEVLYGKERSTASSGDQPDLAKLDDLLRSVRRTGFAFNLERSERGLVAIGRGVLDRTGNTVAAVSVSLPRARYRKERIPEFTSALTIAAEAITANLPA